MTEAEGLAAVTTRAADLPDGAEALGLLVAASLLREVSRETEDVLLAEAPPRQLEAPVRHPRDEREGKYIKNIPR